MQIEEYQLPLAFLYGQEHPEMSVQYQELEAKYKYLHAAYERLYNAHKAGLKPELKNFEAFIACLYQQVADLNQQLAYNRTETAALQAYLDSRDRVVNYLKTDLLCAREMVHELQLKNIALGEDTVSKKAYELISAYLQIAFARIKDAKTEVEQATEDFYSKNELLLYFKRELAAEQLKNKEMRSSFEQLQTQATQQSRTIIGLYDELSRSQRCANELLERMSRSGVGKD